MSETSPIARVRPGEPILGAVLLAGLGILATGCSGGGGSGGGVIPPPASVTLLDAQVQVFGSQCALSGCHAGPGAPLGLDLSSAGTSSGNLVGVASGEVPGLLRVEPYNASDSYLYMKLIADPRIEGDPMPLSAPMLGAADLSLIENWINQGAM